MEGTQVISLVFPERPDNPTILSNESGESEIGYLNETLTPGIWDDLGRVKGNRGSLIKIKSRVEEGTRIGTEPSKHPKTPPVLLLGGF